MDELCSTELEQDDNCCEAEEVGIEPESSAPSPPSTGSSGDTKPTRPLASTSSPSPKRSRRSVQKRVVSIPISEVEGSRAKGAGEGAPPSDSWAWRKYGQKPIKGSPYPRGYYRCSSSKGCPARKQVERSRLDPSMIIVTYSFDHNHPWPLPKNINHHKAAPPVEEPPPPQQPQQQTESSPPDSADRDEKFSNLIGEEESSLLIHAGGFQWLTEGGSPSSTSHSGGSDELLYGSVFFSGTTTDATAAVGLLEEREEMAGGGVGEEDSLFAGLGELPEYSMVFRRDLALASWMGSTV